MRLFGRSQKAFSRNFAKKIQNLAHLCDAPTSIEKHDTSVAKQTGRRGKAPTPSPHARKADLLMRRVTVVLGVAAIMVVMAASSAAAAKPEVDGPFHDEDTVFFADCGEFQILDRYVLDFTIKWFSDKDGNRIRGVEQVSGTDTFINSVTGKEIAAPFHNTVIIDPTTATGANNGVIYRVTVPGSGLVFIDAGRIVTNQAGTEITFQAGPHQAFDGDIAGLCAALE
jgi:uncharacterized protein YehS (DUF1456 family)